MSEEATAQAVEVDETVVEDVEEATAKVDAEATVTEDIVDDEAIQEEDASEPSTEIEPKEKEKDKTQIRIDELTSNIYELKRDRDHWRQQAKQPEPAKVEPVAVKTLADFEYDEGKYAEHIRESVTAEVRQHFANENAQQTHARKETEFRATEAKFASKNSDYYAVTNTPGLEISEGLGDAILGSEMGAEVFYHLGKNLDVASKLSRMDYKSMLKEVVKLEGNLSVKKPVVTSKAPKPAPKIAATDEQVNEGYGKTQESFEKERAKYISRR